MIRKNTVLILGAGASIPYGFPSGYGLVQAICAPGFERLLIERGSGDFDNVEAGRFIHDLQRCGWQSVDSFLEHRPEFLTVGKAAIALALIPFEDSSRLSDRSVDPGWYDHLWSHMKAPPESLGLNKLSILTFNYDRSLEQYFLTVARAAYGMNQQDAVRFVSSIPLVHLHGSLGELYPLARQGRPYDTDVRWRRGCIRICIRRVAALEFLNSLERPIRWTVSAFRRGSAPAIPTEPPATLNCTSPRSRPQSRQSATRCG
jgi:hypothetical protein